MGRDVHLYVEVLDDLGTWRLAPGQWRTCANCEGSELDRIARICAHCGGTVEEHPGEARGCPSGTSAWKPVPARCRRRCREGELLTATYYGARDARLFSILCGEDEGVEGGLAIANRGVPPDACPELAQEATDINWHSHTFGSLEELQRYPWEPNEFTEFATALLKMGRLHADKQRVRVVLWYDN